MRNLLGWSRSSVRDHPLTSAACAVGLNNSTWSNSGGTLADNTSLINTRGRFGVGSSAPGEPLGNALARQFAPLSGACVTPDCTIEKPKLSAATGHGASSS